jgi:single-strand DNA-binding protein
MAAYNRVILMGNLTRDPQLTYTPSNTAVCEFGLAVNEKWRDKSGAPQEYVSYFDCKAFGRTAETINQYVRKGSPLHIEGKLRQSRWQDKEGKSRSRVEVNVDGFQFLPAGGKGESQEPRSEAPAAPQDNGPVPGADADISF